MRIDEQVMSIDGQAKQLIAEGNPDRALEILKLALTEENHSSKIESATHYYIMGNAHRKKGEWEKAMNAYQEAIDLDPNSPAIEAKKHINEIMAFYCKDLYNP